MTKARKRTVIKNKKRFFAFMIMAVVCINIFFIYVYMPENTCADAVEKTRTVTVCAGDTLWSIAQDCADNSDIRNSVYQIKKLNNLKSGELSIGQELLVPLY